MVVSAYWSAAPRRGPDEQDGGVWAWDGERWEHAGSDHGLGSRGHFALAYDLVGDRLLVHGGFGLCFGRDGWRRHEGVSPPAWATHRPPYDEARGRVVLLGGFGDDGLLADTWEWDGDRWTPIGDAGPGARNVHALAWDPDRERLVMFGGLSDAGRQGDTWEMEGRRSHVVDPENRGSI